MTKKKQTKATSNTTVNYSVGDYLIRVKNAANASKSEVAAPQTKLIVSVAKVLEQEKFISSVEVKDGVVTAKIAKHSKEPMLMGLTLISRPGLRHYMNAQELAKIKGPEVYIVSTSKGVVSKKEALKKRIGGEVIAKIW